jgi:hypothetical protein
MIPSLRVQNFKKQGGLNVIEPRSGVRRIDFIGSAGVGGYRPAADSQHGMQCKQSRHGELPDLYRTGRHSGSRHLDGWEPERPEQHIDDAVQWKSSA